MAMTLIRTEHVGTANGKLPNRSTAPDGYGITPLDAIVLGSQQWGRYRTKTGPARRGGCVVFWGPTSAKGTRMYSACPPAYPTYGNSQKGQTQSQP